MGWRPFFRIVNGAVFAPLFLLCVLVQFNDSDPLPWIAVCGCAATLCLIAAAGKAPWRAPAALVTIAFVWMAMLAPSAVTFLRSNRITTAFYMKPGDAVEEQAREAGGLLIVVAWFTVFALHGWRTRPDTKRVSQPGSDS